MASTTAQQVLAIKQLTAEAEIALGMVTATQAKGSTPSEALFTNARNAHIRLSEALVSNSLYLLEHPFKRPLQLAKIPDKALYASESFNVRVHKAGHQQLESFVAALPDCEAQVKINLHRRFSANLTALQVGIPYFFRRIYSYHTFRRSTKSSKIVRSDFWHLFPN